MRDYALGTTFDIKFTTRAFATGVPTTLGGTPSLEIYVGNDTTPITTGITLSVDFSGVAGLNNARIVATSGNGYATASNYTLVIAVGTVGGTSVVGEVVGEFSLEAQSPLRPTVAARTLDVTATGAAGLDWGNIENPTTAQNLSATNIDVDQVIASVSGAVGSVTGNVGGNVNGDVLGDVQGDLVGSIGSLTVGAIAQFFTLNSLQTYATAVAGSVVLEIANNANVIVNNDKTGYAIGPGGIDATSFAVNAIDPSAVDPQVYDLNADAFLLRDLGTGTSASSRNVQNALRASRNRVEVTAGGIIRVYEEDDTTIAWSGVVTRTAGADPLTEVNPA